MTRPPKGQQTMENKAKPITVQIQLDTTHFRAQLAEMAEIARREFSWQAVGAGMFTRAEARKTESATPKLSIREVVQMAEDWVKETGFMLAVGCYPLPPADELIAALTSLAKVE